MMVVPGMSRLASSATAGTSRAAALLSRATPEATTSFRLIDLLGSGSSLSRSFSTTHGKRDRNRSSSGPSEAASKLSVGSGNAQKSSFTPHRAGVHVQATKPSPPHRALRSKPVSSQVKPAKVAETTWKGNSKLDRSQQGVVIKKKKLVGLLDEVEEDTGLDVLLKRGMLVEARRENCVKVGVLLAKVLENRRLRYPLITSDGALMSCSDDDIQYIFPFSPMASKLASEAIPKDMPTVLSAHEDFPPTPTVGGVSNSVEEEKYILPEPAVYARRKLTQMVRNIEKDAENRLREVSIRDTASAEAIWKRFVGKRGIKGDDGHDQWTFVSLDDAARFALGLGPKDKIDPMDRFVVYQIMMFSTEHFLAEEIDMRLKTTFAVRPMVVKEKFDTVRQWIKDHENGKGGSELNEFLTQARAHVGFRREVEAKLLRELGTQQIKPPRLVPLEGIKPFSKTSQAILDVLMDRLMEQRATQTSPLKSTVSTILKLLDLYEARSFDVGLLTEFMRDVGQLKPWETLNIKRLERLERLDSSRFLPSGPVDAEAPLLAEDPHESVRFDFGEQPVYVVDDASAKELDDGVSYEATSNPDQYWLHVHIADPTRWLSPDHPLCLRAHRRAESTYFTEAHRSMLPQEIVMGLMSLKNSEDGSPQCVLSFSALVTLKGELLETKIRAGHIRNIRKMTYDAVDSIMEGGAGADADEVTRRDLTLLHKLLDAVRTCRTASHGLDWGTDLAEVQMDLPSQEDLTSTRPSIIVGFPELKLIRNEKGTSLARQFVSEAMLVAGRISGRYCHEHNLSVAYRGSHKLFVPDLVLPEGRTGDDILSELMAARKPGSTLIDQLDYIRSGMFSHPMPVGIGPTDHWSLGIQAEDGGYARVTSPLRRFQDMICHWQIKSSLLPASENGEKWKPAFDHKTVEMMVKEGVRREKRVKRANARQSQYWITMFLRRVLQGLEEYTEVDVSNMEAMTTGPTTYSTGRRAEVTNVFLPELRVRAEMSESRIGGPALDSERRPLGSFLKVHLLEAEVWPSSIVFVDSLKEQGEKERQEDLMK